MTARARVGRRRRGAGLTLACGAALLTAGLAVVTPSAVAREESGVPPPLWHIKLPSGQGYADGSQFQARISGDGATVGFADSRTANYFFVDELGLQDYPYDVTTYLWDRATRAVTALPVVQSPEYGANSYIAAPSEDGSMVTLTEVYTDCPGGDCNDSLAASAFEPATGETWASVREIGETSSSASGRWLASADRSAQPFVYDTTSRRLVAAPGFIDAYNVQISGGGAQVLFWTSDALVPADTNGRGDVYVWTWRTGGFELVTRADPAASPDTDGWTLFGPGGPVIEPQRFGISRGGRFVVYATDRSDLVAGDDNAASDVFLTDRQTGQTILVSRASQGGPAAGRSYSLDVSGGGRFVLYESTAADIVAGDDNDVFDVFRFDRLTGLTVAISRTATGRTRAGASYDGSMSSDGRSVVFTSTADGLTGDDHDGRSDVFLWSDPSA